MAEERIERRVYTLQELRVEPGAEGEAPQISGYAAVFDTDSEPLADYPGVRFIERVAPGAFAKTIVEHDIRALFNHDPNYVLGRKRAGTLTLREDSHGLAVTILPPDTQWARDLMTSMKRGDLSQMSFMFKTVRDQWEKVEDAQTGARTNKRTLLEVRLYDVSVVTFPAYPATQANARANSGEYIPEPPAEPTDETAAREGVELIERELQILALRADI